MSLASMSERRRSPSVVAMAVRKIVPEECVNLRNSLKQIADDAGFHAPESPIPWIKLRDALQSHIGAPHEDWHFKVIEAVQTHPGTGEVEE